MRYLLVTRQRMPPTADLGANFVIWAILCPIVYFAIFGSVLWQSGHQGKSCNQTTDAWVLECKRVMRHVGGCQVVGIIGLMILLLVDRPWCADAANTNAGAAFFISISSCMLAGIQRQRGVQRRWELLALNSPPSAGPQNCLSVSLQGPRRDMWPWRVML